MTTSTGRVGVFLLPLAVLLPLGVFALLRRSDPFGFHTLILLAVATAPIAATLKGQPFSVQRVVFMFPFAALVATYGLEWLWDQRRPRRADRGDGPDGRACALQFAVFYRDYFTHYKLRSAFYYDPAAFVDVAAYLMADEQAPLIYLSHRARRRGRQVAVLHDPRRPPGQDGPHPLRRERRPGYWPFGPRQPAGRPHESRRAGGAREAAGCGRSRRSSATLIIGRPSPFSENSANRILTRVRRAGL